MNLYYHIFVFQKTFNKFFVEVFGSKTFIFIRKYFKPASGGFIIKLFYIITFSCTFLCAVLHFGLLELKVGTIILSN